MMDPTGVLVSISNILVAVATGVLIIVTAHDARVHSSKDLSNVLDAEDTQNERLVALIDKVIEEHDKHAVTPVEESQAVEATDQPDVDGDLEVDDVMPAPAPRRRGAK